ncbi:MAG TPA: hypothetical protein VG479_03155 [Gaiellaceae bacterium]|jgi:hypothetical protein|nr:hypothetical protein [Gaiellaceae bacterium]
MIGAVLIVMLPLTLAWVMWALLFFTNGPAEEIEETKVHQFLGRGGPDDPRADSPVEE